MGKTRNVRVNYERPFLYPKQERVIFNPARRVICEASTKAGKTLGCILWLHEQALLAPESGRNYLWVAPVHPQTRIAYERMKRMLPAGMFESWDSTQSIRLFNGSTIWFRSGVNPDNLYGDDIWAAVIDEASRCSAGVWHAVRSTLTATRGPVRIIGNVRGTDNWAYELARQAEAGDDPNTFYARLTANDAVEGGVIHKDEVEEARRDLPEDVFNELYMAVPSTRAYMFTGQPSIIAYETLPEQLRNGLENSTARCIRAWDIAATAEKPGKDPDYLVGALMAAYAGKTYILDVVRKRIAPAEALDLFLTTALEDGVDQVIEQEPGASGKMLIHSLSSSLRSKGFTRRVHPSPPSGNKETRAFMAAADWSQKPSGFVLVEGVSDTPWTNDFLDEVRYFPHVKHDDQVDALAHGYNHLQGKTYPAGTVYVPGRGGLRGRRQARAATS